MIARITRHLRASKHLVRTFATTNSTSPTDDLTKISLKQSLTPNVPEKRPETFVEDQDTKITTLSNGLRVASQDRFGAQCAMGVIVSAGPRYEVDRLSGISHYLEKLGFHSSTSFEDRNAVQATMEQCNAIFDCQISRDFIIYAVSGLSSNMDVLVNSLAETVLRPRITAEEVQMAEMSIRFELEAMQRAPPVEPILQELIHGAAYRGNGTVGLPRYCPVENLGRITRDHLINFVSTYYRPERMVFAGVGINHDELVKAVEARFSPFEHALKDEPAAQNAPKPDESAAQYTGGYVKVERDLSQYHAPMPEFAHVALGFESCGYHDPKFVPACLLHSLLGGGGSFSAGGPGKGMYTRFYVNVLNEHHWINSAQAENHTYADTGLFVVSGSSQPSHLDRLLQTLVLELRNTAEGEVPTVELNRAKAQLKSMLLMNLETRAVTFEDIARQVLTTGKRHQPEYWTEKIAEVKASDLQELLHQMLTYSPATVAGFGRLEKLPSLDQVLQSIASPLSSLRGSSRMSNIFRRFQQ